MIHFSSFHRHLYFLPFSHGTSRTYGIVSTSVSLLVGAMLLLWSTPAFAAATNVSIRIRPHCTTGTNCSDFLLYDQDTAITNGLEEGDTFDVDIVLSNPSSQPVQSVQSWLEYDPAVLQGIEVRISDQFPLVAPGENEFSESRGIVKIGASNVSGGVSTPEISFARVTFQVLEDTGQAAFLRFHQFALLGSEGRTKALVVEGGRTVNVLKTRPKSVRLYYGEDPPPSLLANPNQPNGGGGTPNPGSTRPPSTGSPTTGNTGGGQSPSGNGGRVPSPGDVVNNQQPQAFATLQPQGLRVMTEGDKVYLVWSPLPNSAVRGFNIYYGTVSGRYIQRRTISSQSRGMTLGGLPQGTRYYFAITAYNDAQEETEYSQEVAIIVGDPLSSTAPFVLAQDVPQDPPSVPDYVEDTTSPLAGSVIGDGASSVPGRTGLPRASLVLILLLAFGATYYRKRFSLFSRS